jgi:hypothetical protein
MTQAIISIGQAVHSIEAKSERASRTVRIALGFGLLASGYGVVVAEAMRQAFA